MLTLPTISVVTPSFQQGRYLEDTLRSVIQQSYPRLEYVVIDGGSTDESAAIIRRYERHLSYWVSEKDRGQVHALNKGLAKVTGDIFAYLNSDDTYIPGSLAAVGRYFALHPDCHWLCGDTVLFGEGHDTTLVRARVPKSVGHCLSWAYRAAQPGMFWRRPIVDGFREDWSYDFDHELYVRLLLAGHTCYHLPLPLATYRLHAVSKTVAEGARMDAEFDRIAEQYEPQLRWSDRRWSRATRFFRQSYRASQEGRKREAANWLLKGLCTYPEGLADRPFWGCLKRLARPVSVSGHSNSTG